MNQCDLYNKAACYCMDNMYPCLLLVFIKVNANRFLKSWLSVNHHALYDKAACHCVSMLAFDYIICTCNAVLHVCAC